MDLKEMECEILDWINLRIGSIVSCCKCGSETLDLVNGGEYLEKLSDYQLVKDSSLWFLSAPKFF
jgi:hypothetical protein